MKYRAQIISLTSLLDLLFIMIFAMQLKTFDAGNKKVAEKNREVMAKESAITEANKLLSAQQAQIDSLNRRSKLLRKAYENLDKELENEKKKALEVQKQLDKSEAGMMEITLRFDQFLKSISPALGVSHADLKTMLKDLPAEDQQKILNKLAMDKSRTPAVKFMEFKQMDSVKKILTFWHIMLTDTDDVTVRVGTKKDSFSCLSGGPDPLFSREVFIKKMSRFIEDQIGEPAKSSILITYGYSPKSTKFAVDTLTTAVKQLVETLKPKWKQKKFYISDVKLIPAWQR
ncbi:hypothetical protein KKF84_06765 [Myxococcota bacterium]|nr:hypothetical protein [Myxococcota bacterium]MBU1535003.1 hypothetical protein [Myxococcota bacterium]